METPPEPSVEQERAEALWEELGGDLCICQRPDVPHWCERCQIRISLIVNAFHRASRLSLSLPETREALHTGDDELLDALTGARAGIEEAMSDLDDRDQVRESLEGALADLETADRLRVEALGASHVE